MQEKLEKVIISSLHLSTYYIAHARLFHWSWLSGKQSTLQLLKVIPFLHSEKLGRENEIQCTFHVNDSHHQLFDMIHGSSNLAKVLNYYKGSFTNYVDKFWAFLTTYPFRWHFRTTYPLLLVNIVCEQPLSQSITRMDRFSPNSNYGILLQKLFWPTVRKNCSSNREKLLGRKS